MQDCCPDSGDKESITRFNAVRKIHPREYPEFLDHLNFENLADAIGQILVYFKRVPLDRKFQYRKDIYPDTHMIIPLETFKTFLGKNRGVKAVRKFIRKHYLVYESAGNAAGDVLFTGYFEPTYESSLKQSKI